MKEIFTDAWNMATRRQQIVLAIGGFALTGLLTWGWAIAAVSWGKVKIAEQKATAARRDADGWMKKAAEIGAELRKREEALAKLEGQRDEKQKELDAARGDVNRAGANYNAARGRRGDTTPSADELCRELADAGYPCG